MVLGIKEALVECATVCVKSVVILEYNLANVLENDSCFCQGLLRKV